MAIDLPDSLCLRPRQEPRGSYLKPPAIEAGGGWVRRGGAFSRASGPIWVAWPRPAVGGLQPSNDALVTLAPASGLGHTQQHSHQQQQQQLLLPLLVLLLAGVCLCSGLLFVACLRACFFALRRFALLLAFFALRCLLCFVVLLCFVACLFVWLACFVLLCFVVFCFALACFFFGWFGLVWLGFVCLFYFVLFWLCLLCLALFVLFLVCLFVLCLGCLV